MLPDPSGWTTSLYAVLAEAGHRPVRALQRISAVNLGPDDAALLQVEPGEAGLRIERISYLADGSVAEFTRSHLSRRCLQLCRGTATAQE